MKAARYPTPEGFEPLKGYTFGYDINRDGQIWSRFTGRLLKPRMKKYPMVVLSEEDGRQHEVTIHRLVATQFIPNPDNLPEVNHKDEDKNNYKADNLEWCTKRYNKTYSTGKAVVAYSDTESATYPSIREAGRQVGDKNGSNILTAIKSGSTYAGYHWCYKEDYDGKHN